jgi:hypothetical protein
MQDNIVAANAKVDCMFLSQEICAMQDVFCFAALADAITGTMYTNITGAFPVCLFKSMQYSFIAYVFDLKTIIVHAMPSCTDAPMVQAFTKVITILKPQGYQPALNVMDNKCFNTVEKYIRSEKSTSNLSPSTTIMSMPLNRPLLLSKKTSSLLMPLLIRFAHSSYGMNFFHKSNLH